MAKILVVDDEPSNLRVMQHILGRRGHAVVAARTPEEAIAFASATGDIKFDVVVADVTMAPIDGVQVVARIHKEQPGPAILFISGYPLDMLADAKLVKREDVASGRCLFLQKPFSAQDLCESVADALIQRELGSAELDEEFPPRTA